MKPTTLKVARIGNSRGVRLPATTLERFGIGDSVIMEERSDGILLRPVRSGPAKLSWSQTAAAIAQSDEDWSEWEITTSDGLANVPWNAQPEARVAEQKPSYTASKPKAGRRNAK